MLRPLTTVAFLFALAPALAAQDKPTPAAKAAISGNWKFDLSRSDTVPRNPLGIADKGAGGSPGAKSAPATIGGGGGGKGKGGGGGGGGGGAGAADAGAAGGDLGGGGGGGGRGGAGAAARDPRMMGLMQEIAPSPSLVITASDSIVTIADANGQTITWRTDGRKHVEAAMSGGATELKSQWKTDELELDRNVPAGGLGAELKRNFKVSKDGKTLEIKLHLDYGSKNGEAKLIYTREP